MTIYFVIILTAGILGYIYDKIDKDARAVMNALFTLYFTLVIGLRDKVGVDWYNYVRMYNRFNTVPWRYDTHELLYKLVNILGFQSGIGFGFVIFITSAIFIMAIIKGAEAAKINPYYFFVLSGGYIFVMAGVNYIRQGVALAVMVIAFAHLLNGDKLKFFIYTLLAGLFHTSAILLVFFIVIDFNIFFIVIGLILLLVIILYLPLDRYENYITSNMESAGLYLRVSYLIVPVMYLSLNYLYWKEKNRLTKRIYLACISSPLVMLILAMISSTIADRVSYYFIVLITLIAMQIAMNNKSNRGTLYLAMIFLVSISSLSVWVAKSKYIPNYIYQGYISEWLS
ncbi:EpsG family protein [Enterobacter asburiae]